MTLSNDSDYFLELQTQTGWARMLVSFSRWCAPLPGQQVLDIGTGPGLLPAIFARDGIQAYGIDLDMAMFAKPVHPQLSVANSSALPFESTSFEIVSASNVLFLAEDPANLLAEMGRVSSHKICLLNPSERMTVEAAEQLSNENNLSGLARETLLNLARRAETHFRWSESDLEDLFFQAGFELTDSTLRMGPGLIRYACGQKI